MKILFIVPYVPDLIRVRPYNLIRYLARQGHSVTVLTIWSNAYERKAANELKKYCSDLQAFYLPKWRSYLNALLTVPTRTPLQASYCWHPALVEHAVRLLTAPKGQSHFDIVHVEHLRGARLGLALKKQNSKIPVVWDSVDSISYLFRQAMANSKRIYDRLLTGFELGRTEKYEGWLPNQFDHTLVTSQADKNAFEELNPTSSPNISVVPNGVDLEFFKPDPDSSRDQATLVLSGKMSYHANIAMALYLINEIMPKVWAEREDIRINIVGKDPPAAIQALTQYTNVNVTGTVPDLRPYLQKATIAVAPITYGAGIQNKILEAMACGTPVITTPKAAFGLQVTPNEDILVGEDSAAFAHAILKLMNNFQFRQQLGTAGRRFVEKHHHWDEVVSKLINIYDKVIQK